MPHKTITELRREKRDIQQILNLADASVRTAQTLVRQGKWPRDVLYEARVAQSKLREDVQRLRAEIARRRGARITVIRRARRQ